MLREEIYELPQFARLAPAEAARCFFLGLPFSDYSPIRNSKPFKDLTQARLNSCIIFGRLRVDDGLCGSYASKPDRTITSGLLTIRL
jgi:hypothetical protein